MTGVAVGLFGKLPAKRDFVSRGLGRDFLGPFEPWLQAAVADSRDALGADWRGHFLAAPIWRFVVGADVFGCAALGAIMPSVDGVGRYFPLVGAATAGEGAAFAGPDEADHEPWFARLEAVLLDALDAVPFERTANALAAIGAPVGMAGPDPPSRGTVWWTAGGAGFPQRSAIFDGLPPATFMRRMIRATPATAAAGATLP